MADIVKELEDLDKLFMELEEVESKPATGEPQSEAAAPPSPSGEASVSSAPAVPEAPPENLQPVQGVSILPQTGRILEDVRGALELIAMGMQAGIVKAGLQETNDQLGPLSVVLSLIKKTKSQVDAFLGNRS